MWQGEERAGIPLLSALRQGAPGSRAAACVDEIKRQNGAPGVDGESFLNIEARWLTEWLNGLVKELHDKTYQPEKSSWDPAERAILCI